MRYTELIGSQSDDVERHSIAYQANSFLARALKKIRQDIFEKMIVFLGWENVERTNNHVERNNRVFRMLQKTRYTLYKPLLIEAPVLREVFIPFEEPDRQKMAA